LINLLHNNNSIKHNNKHNNGLIFQQINIIYIYPYRKQVPRSLLVEHEVISDDNSLCSTKDTPFVTDTLLIQFDGKRSTISTRNKEELLLDRVTLSYNGKTNVCHQKDDTCNNFWEKDGSHCDDGAIVVSTISILTNGNLSRRSRDVDVFSRHDYPSRLSSVSEHNSSLNCHLIPSINRNVPIGTTSETKSEKRYHKDTRFVKYTKIDQLTRKKNYLSIIWW